MSPLAPQDQLVYYLMIFLWLSYLPLLIISLERMLKNRRVFIVGNPVRVRNDPQVIFQITARSASRSDVVSRGLDSIRAACEEISYSEFSVSIVTDDPTDASRFPDEAVVVPQDFRTANGASGKARALQYAVERRRIEGKSGSDHWIFHLDEESVVTSQTVGAILQFIRKREGLIAEGPIFYPMKLGQARRLTALAESIRPFQCYDCVGQMTEPPPLHMHGSNLLVRSDVEDSVGWDFETVAEDQLFGVEAYRKWGDIFGWHGGVLLEQPPLTLRDHFRQRSRWIAGTLQNMKRLPREVKLRIYGRLVTYWLGFLSAFATMALYAYSFLPGVIQFVANHVGIAYEAPPVAQLPVATPASLFDAFSNGFNFTFTWSAFLSDLLGAALFFAFVGWVVSYQVGLYWNLKYAGLTFFRRLGLHVQQFVLCPFVGLLETIPGFATLIGYYVLGRRRVSFQITGK